MVFPWVKHAVKYLEDNHSVKIQARTQATNHSVSQILLFF